MTGAVDDARKFSAGKYMINVNQCQVVVYGAGVDDQYIGQNNQSTFYRVGLFEVLNSAAIPPPTPLLSRLAAH